jgi:fermentation-respiration switch protein FrsA (DUF1100 family)
MSIGSKLANAVRKGKLASTVFLGLTVTGFKSPLWETPAERDLPYEEVTFTSTDGVQLYGWFVPAAGDSPDPAPTVVQLHGGTFTRLGLQDASLWGAEESIDLMASASALQEAGFNVLVFDFRNHGLSQTAMPITFGINETHDLVGAVEMLRERPDVDDDRIGIIGWSMGANTTLFGIPRCGPIPAAVAVQPVDGRSFFENVLRNLFGAGALTPVLLPVIEGFYRFAGGPAWADVDPSVPARTLSDTKVMYVQAEDDEIGSLENVETFADRTPRARLVTTEQSRLAGYQFVENSTDVIVEFFTEHLRDAPIEEADSTVT